MQSSRVSTPKKSRRSSPIPTQFYAGYEVETPYLRNALVKAGVKVPFMASDGAFLSATIDESDGTAEGMYLSSFAPAPSAVVDKAWIAAYQAVENRNPETYSINGYSALKTLGEAVKKANSIETKQVEAALHAIDLTTPIGHISYDANGDLKSADQRIYIFQVQKAGDELEFVRAAIS
jgi:branched-chain amino acid transport system substrate-binding protein